MYWGAKDSASESQNLHPEEGQTVSDLLMGGEGGQRTPFGESPKGRDDLWLRPETGDLVSPQAKTGGFGSQEGDAKRAHKQVGGAAETGDEGSKSLQEKKNQCQREITTEGNENVTQDSHQMLRELEGGGRWRGRTGRKAWGTSGKGVDRQKKATEGGKNYKSPHGKETW